jgi:FkbM family methyltransferase
MYSKTMRDILLKFLIIVGRPFVGKGLHRYRLFRWLVVLFESFFYGLNTGEKTLELERKGIAFTLEVDPKNGIIERDLIVKGVFSPHLYDVFTTRIQRGNTVVDVGANIGYFTLLFSKIVGENGKVYSFEPVSQIYAKLQNNIEINRAGNIVAENCALGEEQSVTTINYQESSLGQSSFVNKIQHGVSEKVHVVTLDSYLGKFDTLDFIKIDIEGFEFQALRGMQKTLSKFMPSVVMEFSPLLYRNIDEDYLGYSRSLLNFMVKLGYQIKNIDGEYLEDINDIRTFVSSNGLMQRDLLFVPA